MSDMVRVGCIPCGHESEFPPYKHSVVITCPECGKNCYLAPKCKTLVDAGKATPVCLQCVCEQSVASGESIAMITLTDKGKGE